MKKNVELDSKLAEVFCFSTWTAPVVCDYSSNGAYSNGIAARIYKQAAERMPSLLLLAAFSKKDVVQNMQGFMDNWERAESRFTKDDLALLEQIDAKDRGPFLYWLLNERAFRSACDQSPASAGSECGGRASCRRIRASALSI